MWSGGGAKVAISTSCCFWVCFCDLFASAGVLLSLFTSALSTGPTWKELLGPFLALWSPRYSLSATGTFLFGPSYLEDKCRLCVVFDCVGKILVKGQKPQNLRKWQVFFFFFFLTGETGGGTAFNGLGECPKHPWCHHRYSSGTYNHHLHN